MLSEPVKKKHSVSGFDDRIMYASSEMQGWKISMEDAHAIILKLLDKKGYSYFGVFDGHAHYSCRKLHDRIAKDYQFEIDLKTAIQNGFLGTDDDLKNDPQLLLPLKFSELLLESIEKLSSAIISICIVTLNRFDYCQV
ncbi:14398_t:CDS:2 [Racocetra fulgida]|uniref:14398_t:CDS:1 n=1 Tax=Racocetra fulgida TaxID=60492 RepID=A0A9N8VQU9_9GLOM|nr:14398_t:CDS:2 [Racocetra fulgida]